MTVARGLFDSLSLDPQEVLFVITARTDGVSMAVGCPNSVRAARNPDLQAERSFKIAHLSAANRNLPANPPRPNLGTYGLRTTQRCASTRSMIPYSRASSGVMK